MQQENEDLPDIDMENILMTQDNGITFIKSLEEIMDQKNVTYTTDIINLFLGVVMFILYIMRTYMMCKFDTNPIWRVPATSEGPTLAEYPMDKWDWSAGRLPPEVEMEHFFPSE
jgi:hypothetical protein